MSCTLHASLHVKIFVVKIVISGDTNAATERSKDK